MVMLIVVLVHPADHQQFGVIVFLPPGATWVLKWVRIFFI
jgi:hypothetical protein